MNIFTILYRYLMGIISFMETMLGFTEGLILDRSCGPFFPKFFFKF
jgi:hypothetical protein